MPTETDNLDALRIKQYAYWAARNGYKKALRFVLGEPPLNSDDAATLLYNVYIAADALIEAQATALAAAEQARTQAVAALDLAIIGIDIVRSGSARDNNPYYHNFSTETLQRVAIILEVDIHTLVADAWGRIKQAPAPANASGDETAG